MKITQRLLQIILIQALLALVLVSCTNAASVDPTLVQQATLTQLPSSTATIPPTATITLEPTLSPGQIADSLGLLSEPLYGGRTFEYREVDGVNYLVDLYNNAPKAVRTADGAWRRLDYGDPADAEAMYGALVPEGGGYILPEIRYTGSDYEARVINPVYLGDWEVEEVDYDGQRVHLYHLLAGLRDGGGRLHVVRLAYDAPDLEPEHWVVKACANVWDSPDSNGGGISSVPFDYLLTGYLRVGETLGVSVFEVSSFPHITYKEIGPGPESNNVHRMIMKNLYTEFPDLYQLSPAEKMAMEDYRWPDRTVTLALPYGVGVRQDPANEHCWR